MNILPKKRWHVRTKENIARVRRDEALAAEQAKIEQARIDKAESEARLNYLREESRKKYGVHVEEKQETNSLPVQSTSKHINFFEEIEKGSTSYKKTNKDYEKEKKEEQEKYEKQIGLLTYLGQGLQEEADKRWYNEIPKRLKDLDKNIEVKPKRKAFEDPMKDIKRYLNILAFKKETSGSELKFKDSGTKPIEEFQKIKKRKRSSSNSSEDDNKYSKKKKSKKHSSSDSERSSKKHKKLKKQKKSKKHKKKKDKVSELEKLRAERLKREQQEKLRTQELLKSEKVSDNLNTKPYKQKYSSQFFPELARQNCEKFNK